MCLCFSAAFSLTGCRQDMQNQPKFKPLRATWFFPDGASARPLVPGTIPQGGLRHDELLYTGRVNGELANVLPFPVSRQLLDRGRERFNIFCSPCHGQIGNGEGMVVQRGFRRPPSFHIDRLREAPVGHFVDVIASGYGAMADYAGRVAPRDRWAIAAYIRALQFSQNAALDDVPEDQRRKLSEQPQ